MIRRITLVAALLLSCGGQVPAEPHLAGTWKLALHYPGAGPCSGTMDLAGANGALTGTYALLCPKDVAIPPGTVELIAYGWDGAAGRVLGQTVQELDGNVIPLRDGVFSASRIVVQFGGPDAPMLTASR